MKSAMDKECGNERRRAYSRPIGAINSEGTINAKIQVHGAAENHKRTSGFYSAPKQHGAVGSPDPSASSSERSFWFGGSVVAGHEQLLGEHFCEE
jgi:hypothetical protein